MQQWKTYVVAGATAVAVAGGVGASPAAASDETLKVAITHVIPQVAPKVQAFVKEADAATSSGDVTRLRKATDNVRRGMSLYKWTVVNYKASTESGLAAKKDLLVAIREYDIGFAAYNNALVKLQKGASKASTLKSLRTFAKRIREASSDEEAALTAFGISGS